MNALDQNLHLLHVHVINSHNICNIYWPIDSINCPSISHAIFYNDSSFNLKDPQFPSKNDYHLGLSATDSHVSQQPVDIICLRNCQFIPDTALPVDNNSPRQNFDKGNMFQRLAEPCSEFLAVMFRQRDIGWYVLHHILLSFTYKTHITYSLKRHILTKDTKE